MSKFKEEFQASHIYLALATGISIIGMALLSKYILPVPLGYLDLAIPPFFATIFETVYKKHKGKKICTSRYWVAAILIATVIVVIMHL